MLFLIFAGIIALVFGGLILFSPQTIRNLNDKVSGLMGRFVFSVDEEVYRLRVGIGISLILASGLFFFVAYFLIKKYG